MPSVQWNQVFDQPLATWRIIYHSSIATLKIVFARLSKPWTSHPLAFGTAVRRAWLGNTFVYNPLIFYSEPKHHSTQNITNSEFTLYSIPTSTSEERTNADAIILFAHGGGMISGHPLQYLSEYQRWVKRAGEMDKKLVLLTLKYRKSSLPSLLWNE
jgi:hypothetical protein